MASIKIRFKILELSLVLESYTSILLKMILNISDDKESISFGRKSESLSFNNKVNLLMDLDFIEADDLKFLKLFMFIRNQFMHNFDVYDFESVFNQNEQLRKQLEKILGIKIENKNEQIILKNLRSKFNPIILKIQRKLKENAYI